MKLKRTEPGQGNSGKHAGGEIVSSFDERGPSTRDRNRFTLQYIHHRSSVYQRHKVIFKTMLLVDTPYIYVMDFSHFYLSFFPNPFLLGPSQYIPVPLSRVIFVWPTEQNQSILPEKGGIGGSLLKQGWLLRGYIIIKTDAPASTTFTCQQSLKNGLDFMPPF